MHTKFRADSVYSRNVRKRFHSGYKNRRPEKSKALSFEKALSPSGAEWIRTTDSRIFSPMLYQLSYSTLNWGAQK